MEIECPDEWLLAIGAGELLWRPCIGMGVVSHFGGLVRGKAGAAWVGCMRPLSVGVLADWGKPAGEIRVGKLVDNIMKRDMIRTISTKPVPIVPEPVRVGNDRVLFQVVQPSTEIAEICQFFIPKKYPAGQSTKADGRPTEERLRNINPDLHP